MMKCLVADIFTLFLAAAFLLNNHVLTNEAAFVTAASSTGSYETTDQTNRNLFNRMICENEKLQINCQKDHGIKIERAYYGRYSITPCNPYHMKFTKGCTANDSLAKIQLLCDDKQSCEIHANSSTFGVPCPNSVHILEVIYACFKKKVSIFEAINDDGDDDGDHENDEDDGDDRIKPSSFDRKTGPTTLPTLKSTLTKKSTKLKQAKKSKHFRTTSKATNSSTTVSSSTRSVEIDFNYKENESPPSAFNSISNKNKLNRVQKVNANYNENEPGKFAEKKGCFKSLVYANLNATIDMIIRLNCSNLKKNYSEYTSGSVWLKCGHDGEFTQLNSSCSYSKSSFMNDLNKRLKSRQNSFTVFEKIDSELHNYLQSNGSISDLVLMLKNASENLHIDTIMSKTSNLNVSNLIFGIANSLLSKTEKWSSMNRKTRLKMATLLLDLIDQVTFDDYTENFINSDLYYLEHDEAKNPFSDFNVFRENLIAELSSNYDLNKELTLPRNSDSSDKINVKLTDPNWRQKFMFISYKNMHEIFPNDFHMPNSNDLHNSETPPDALVKIHDKKDSSTAAPFKIEQLTEKEVEVSSFEANNDAFRLFRIINSNILSFKMNDKNEINYLKENPIELVFTHLRVDIFDSTNNYMIKTACSFLDYNKESYEADWSTDGCETVSSNKTHTVCKCNHLTHFAIIMDIYNVQNKISALHKIILTSLTILLSSISCVCIILTLLAFKYIKLIKKNREQSATKDLTTITTHLCICLLGSLIVFLFGMIVQELKMKTFCSIVALLSHYLFLCSFFWMLLEGVQLYLMLVRIFLLDKSPIRKFCLLAYGCPFLIVLTSKIVDYNWLESRGYGTQEHCWLSNEFGFNLSFVIPVSVILLINMLILVIVTYGVRNSISNKQSQSKRQQDFLKSLLGFWCLILTLLGIPWILGYFMLDHKNTLPFSYLFTILNSSQGTIIFVFHCVISKNVRDELLKAIRNHKNRFLSSNTNSPGSSSSSKTFIYRGTLNKQQQQQQQQHINKSLETQNLIKNNLNRGASNSSSSYKVMTAHQQNTNEAKTLINNNINKKNSILTDGYNRNAEKEESSLISMLEYLLDMFFCFCWRASRKKSSSSTLNSTSLQSGSTNLDLQSKQYSAVLSINDENNETHETLNKLLHGQNLMYQNVNLHNTLSYLHNNSYLTAKPSLNASLYFNRPQNGGILIPILNPTLVKNSNSANIHIVARTATNGAAHHPSCDANRYLATGGANLILIPSTPVHHVPVALSVQSAQNQHFSTFKSSTKLKKREARGGEKEEEEEEREEYWPQEQYFDHAHAFHHTHNMANNHNNDFNNYVEVVDEFIDGVDFSKHQQPQELHYSNLNHAKLKNFSMNDNDDDYSNILVAVSSDSARVNTSASSGSSGLITETTSNSPCQLSTDSSSNGAVDFLSINNKNNNGYNDNEMRMQQLTQRRL